ncbi:MAG: hypothetical protein ACP5IE_06775 [Infirmifilum sp.]
MSTIPDMCSYAAGNPMYTVFISILIIVGALTITIIVFRWYDRSHEHAAENTMLNQQVQDMIANRMESLEYNKAIVRQINATAAAEEQLAVTLTVLNSILAGEGLVKVAETAKEITKSSGEASAQK